MHTHTNTYAHEENVVYRMESGRTPIKLFSMKKVSPSTKLENPQPHDIPMEPQTHDMPMEPQPYDIPTDHIDRTLYNIPTSNSYAKAGPNHSQANVLIPSTSTEKHGTHYNIPRKASTTEEASDKSSVKSMPPSTVSKHSDTAYSIPRSTISDETSLSYFSARSTLQSTSTMPSSGYYSTCPDEDYIFMDSITESEHGNENGRKVVRLKQFQ